MLLYVTGSRFKYEKRNSVDSSQFADGGIVSYELRPPKRKNRLHVKSVCQFVSKFENFIEKIFFFRQRFGDCANAYKPGFFDSSFPFVGGKNFHKL